MSKEFNISCIYMIQDVVSGHYLSENCVDSTSKIYCNAKFSNNVSHSNTEMFVVSPYNNAGVADAFTIRNVATHDILGVKFGGPNGIEGEAIFFKNTTIYDSSNVFGVSCVRVDDNEFSYNYYIYDFTNSTLSSLAENCDNVTLECPATFDIIIYGQKEPRIVSFYEHCNTSSSLVGGDFSNFYPDVVCSYSDLPTVLGAVCLGVLAALWGV